MKELRPMPLVTTPNLSAPDDFYEALIDAHRDLSTEESHALNARLVLVLVNHVGDLDVLREALGIARSGSRIQARQGS
jgi:hypothetical protein